jgi:hypothetical protein
MAGREALIIVLVVDIGEVIREEEEKALPSIGVAINRRHGVN